MKHEADWLRDYLVAGVEDPRLNLQSILSRHFLLRALTGDQFGSVMTEECRFSAVMNWLVSLVGRVADTEELAAVLYALRRGGDNAEGIEIPQFVVRAFAALPSTIGELHLPNYIESMLGETEAVEGQAHPHDTGSRTFHEPGRGRSRPRQDPCGQAAPRESASTTFHGPERGRLRPRREPVAEDLRERGSPRPALDTFQQLWRAALSRLSPQASTLSVLEPACGSANDYRFLQAYGLVPLLDYTGFDLCSKNVENARALFPGARFEVGNVFQIDAADMRFDLCFVHDLFEHLSLAGMEAAVREVCRVTRNSLCIGFFQMDEIREHVVRPVDDYHWNLLSMARMKELFRAQGFEAQVIHIATFLSRQLGSDQTHNPNAYTFLLRRTA